MNPVIIPIEQWLNRHSVDEKVQLERAMKLVSSIDDDPDYCRPKGIEIAAILTEFNVDLNTLLAAILSDSRLTTLPQPPDITALFGKTVAILVKDVNWLNTLRVYSPEMASKPNQSETLRQMLLSMTKDVRAVLIKLAYRVKRLRNLSQESKEIQQFIAQETFDIYAPIANRLGIHQFKWELEDTALRYLDADTYHQIAQSLAVNRKAREACIRDAVATLKEKIAEENIVCQCYGRPKHIYSIWKKMQSKNLNIDELYDLLAIRVIVDNLRDCYTVLSIVHSVWQNLPKEFDDYIANPKENGYQSLHTVIIEPEGNRIEVQIRTQAMHDYAELGFAAHWSYKEGGKKSETMEKNVALMRKLLDNKSSVADHVEPIDDESYSDRIYVLTPAGEIIDLIRGATPLDFAYAIHTELGHRCRGAKINGRIVPLTYCLKSGEKIEILTVKESRPNRNWMNKNLGYLKSPRSIQKVKTWFTSNSINGCPPSPIKAELLALAKLLDSSDIKKDASIKVRPQKKSNPSEVSVAGLDNIQTTFARCCQPVSGDDIVGYISHQKGIIVHQRNCLNITQLSDEKQAQLLTATWGSGNTNQMVSIVVYAFNALNLLTDVSYLLASFKIHIFAAHLESQSDLSAELNLTLQIENAEQLNEVLTKIKQLPAIIDAERKI